MKYRNLVAHGILLLFVLWLISACASSATPDKITVTFTADSKCNMEGPTTLPAGEDISVDVIGNLSGHGTVGLAILKLDPDKTISDLEDMPFDADQPDWSLRVGFYEFPSDGTTYSFVLNQADGPIYFVCFYEADGKIGALGPLEVTQQS